MKATWSIRSTPRTARATALMYNPGAHTHYSYALRDALGSVSTPCVEVHISDVSTREAFRHISVIAPACVAQVKGRGFAGYNDALDILLEGTAERLGEGFGGALRAGPSHRSRTISLTNSMKAQAAGRLERLRNAAAENGIRTFLVRDTASIEWLTAFDGVFDDEQAHALLVTPHDAVLHTDSVIAARRARRRKAKASSPSMTCAKAMVNGLPTCSHAGMRTRPPAPRCLRASCSASRTP